MDIVGRQVWVVERTLQLTALQKIGLPYFLDIYSIHKLLKDILHLANLHNSACLCNGIIYNLP